MGPQDTFYSQLQNLRLHLKLVAWYRRHRDHPQSPLGSVAVGDTSPDTWSLRSGQHRRFSPIWHPSVHPWSLGTADYIWQCMLTFPICVGGSGAWAQKPRVLHWLMPHGSFLLTRSCNKKRPAEVGVTHQSTGSIPRI